MQAMRLDRSDLTGMLRELVGLTVSDSIRGSGQISEAL